MIRYPNGKIYNAQEINQKKKTKNEISFSSANRGMDLENDINISNNYYNNEGVCLITKRPTPINVCKVDYTNGCRITDAYFEKQSTTDYNGIYKEKYIDFEAKNTKSKTSFPLANICYHQITHLKKVIEFNGIAFFIIQFAYYNEAYLLDAKYIIDFYEKGDRKSIPYETIKEKGILIKRGYIPRLFYIDAIDEMYFKR